MSAHDEKETAKKNHPSHSTNIENVFNAIASAPDSVAARAKAALGAIANNTTDENFEDGFSALSSNIHTVVKWIRKGVK